MGGSSLVPATKDAEFIKYQHHGIKMSVRKGTVGLHREHCLCYSCEAFVPYQRHLNCPIANKLYALCVEHSVVTPVWECHDFKQKEEE